jgi:hypothetical protein
MGFMKTTLELPDELFRKAKATAASSGQSLKAFFTEALQAKLAKQHDRLRKALDEAFRHFAPSWEGKADHRGSYCRRV